MSEILINGKTVFKDPEVILFDKDGTLIDIHHYWVSMIKIRSSLIAKRWFAKHPDIKNIELILCDVMGVDINTGKMKPEGPVGVKPRSFIVNVASDMVRYKGVNIVNDEMESLFIEVDQKTSEDILPLLKLLPGAITLLESLKKCDIATAIVSTDITSRARLSIEALKLNHLFDDIIGGDSVKNTKPSPDLALAALNKSQYNANKTIVIGDHPVDINMGVSANVGLNIGVLTGLSEIKSFEGLECEVIPNLTNIEVRC